MIYNQKQRQLIIWDQKSTRETINSFMLLFNLGMRIMSRNTARKVRHAFSYEAKPMDMVFRNETVVNS